MKLVARLLMIVILVSFGGEFLAPLFAPTHHCDQAAVAVEMGHGDVASAKRPASDCHHHSPICELSDHCHSGKYEPVTAFQVANVISVVFQSWEFADESLPQSPHLSGLKRPPIAVA